ncbi:hypothetical protein [Rhizobium sp. SSA_523]|uniref:hypothetical protein n=1 Tax=Rhizobium sp. SSA_523 TaxID=2952477 RepID=UPI002090E0E8|nr:hypothetical protein [Rhizobium sp. SSA_523]MCO5730224.1 hypothetical protein [Rhizobium sp. SSA_523]WKC25282.1 hypothetical protein QTJ18_14990 [Rhizobium sp. SSA_523]
MRKLIAATTLAALFTGATAALAMSDPVPNSDIAEQVRATEATARLTKSPPGSPVYDKVYTGVATYSVTYTVQPDGSLKFAGSSRLERD